MRVVFDLDFDGGYWPGPLGWEPAAGTLAPWGCPARRASAGEAWVGPAGFLGILETALGLGGPETPAGLRTAALLGPVRAGDGFWSASTVVDPLGTARTLLAWRDELMLHGWQGEPATPRLAELARVTTAALPGLPDRLAAVAETLARRGADLKEVVLGGPPEELPRLWCNVLDRLAARGTTVRQMEPAGAVGPPVAQAGGAKADVQLIRPQGPLDAAEEAAAWLAAFDSLDGTVIVGADSVLDAALHCHGLPVTGAPDALRDNALLQVLPLAVALGWSPADPQRALELLSLPLSPVPPALARRLAGALHEWPAVDSDAWRGALAEGLDAVEEPARRERLSDRLEALFGAAVPRSGDLYPVAEARRRALVVNRWLRGRAGREETSSEAWAAASCQIARFLESLEASGLAELPAALLQRFLEEATAAAPATSARPAQAGVSAVAAPGGVAGPARTVLWWGFTQASAPPPARLPFSPAERAALAAAGTLLPDPGRQMELRACRWRRPVNAALEDLLLVCPRLDAVGEESHPHPLWDELSVRGRRRERSRLVFPGAVAAVRRALRGIPTPRRRWNVLPDAVARRAVESPSSLETLAACPFKWVLTYAGGLRDAVGALPDATSEQLAGNLAHHVLAQVLRQGELSPEAAAAAARRLFEQEGPRLTAPFFLPGAEHALAALRRMVEESARTVTALLQRWGRQVRAVETPFRQPFGAGDLEGTPDLVVGDPVAVVDFKHAGSGYRFKVLENGAACQLAAYSFLVGNGAALAPAAYFILAGRRLLSGDPTAFPGGEPVYGPSLSATWQALLAALEARWLELAGGSLPAAGVPETPGAKVPDQSGLSDGVLALAPPCRFCHFGPLCGRTFGGEA